MSRPDRTTFRLPAVALFFPVLLMFCITPLATSGGAWWVAFVAPALALVWVIVTRTTATADRITAYGLLGVRRMAWAEMDGLELRHSQWTIAVGMDGRRLRLPMVRPRDLPRLAAVSGGSLNFGTGDSLEPADADKAAQNETAQDQAAQDQAAQNEAAEAEAEQAETKQDQTAQDQAAQDEKRPGTSATPGVPARPGAAERNAPDRA